MSGDLAKYDRRLRLLSFITAIVCPMSVARVECSAKLFPAIIALRFVKLRVVFSTVNFDYGRQCHSDPWHSGQFSLSVMLMRCVAAKGLTEALGLRTTSFRAEAWLEVYNYAGCSKRVAQREVVGSSRHCWEQAEEALIPSPAVTALTRPAFTFSSSSAYLTAPFQVVRPGPYAPLSSPLLPLPCFARLTNIWSFFHNFS